MEMTTSLAADSRGIILPCPTCDSANRIAYARLGQKGSCGTCKTELPLPALPVDVISEEDFTNLISQSPLPVIVDFWATWCGPCKMMAPEFTKAVTKASGRAILAKVNTEKLPGISNTQRIQGIPAFILYKGGSETARTTGFQPADRLLTWAGVE
mgnify:FL=1|tara:strand:- start:315 stop:779 length:465 start_codon:yes stop_codon:yes gene_type:complete